LRKLVGADYLRDAFVVGWSGSFNTWCDVETAFAGLEAAMAEVPSLVFLATGGAVAGHDERSYAAFTSRVRASAFRDRFRLLGWVGDATARACMRTADVGLVVERDLYERRLGSENRVVHWMSAGVPCVTTALSELGRSLVARGLAYEARPGDPASLAQALVAAAADRAGARAMGEACRTECEQRYGYSSTAHPLVEWCREPRAAADHGRERMVAIGSLTEPRAMVHLLEAYLDELTLGQVAFRAFRWLLRRPGRRDGLAAGQIERTERAERAG
jgi:glycosyltransferase involved in cell wall biosynthesis